MNSKEDIETKKSSTMNSLYIGSTIDKPNVDLIINAVATILHSQMIEVFIKQSDSIYYNRIKVKERLSLKIVISFSFQKRNTF